MADLSKLTLPVKDNVTGEVTNQTFDLKSKCDTELSNTSTYPLTNRAVTEELGSRALQFSVMPVPAEKYLPKIVQYSGATNNSFTKGHFYECIINNNTYSWRELPIGTGGDSIQYETMPNASVEWLGKVIEYTGTTNNTYTKGYFYECVYEDEMYYWKVVEFLTGDAVQYSEMPVPGAEYLDRIVQYTGSTAPYINGFFYKCVYNEDEHEYYWSEWLVQPVSETVHLVDVFNASIEREFKVATICWCDPVDSVFDEQIVAQWGGTKVVRKVGSVPQHEFDGDLIINSRVRDAYAEEGFVDNTLEYDKVYYYRFFPYSTTNVVTKGTSFRVHCQRVQVPLPSQVGALYYNQKTQAPELTAEVGIAKSGQINGIEVGNYEMTLSLISDDYQWTDKSFTDKSITWTIQKAQATITPSASSVTLGRHSITSKTISFSDLYDREITDIDISDSDICNATIVGDEIAITLGSDVGNATITVTTDSTDNSLEASAVISVTSLFQVIYGFHIDGTESDSSAMVSYIPVCDNYGYTPAHMNFSTGQLSYGSWSEDEFFMPRPCMLKYDGTVAYYLDPDDYTKKENGAPSDVADPTFDGNAMMEWGRDGYKIWYKIVPDSDTNISASIYISNYQVDEDYVDWSFHNCDSESVDHFYTPIYNGSLINGVLRSLSGQAPASKAIFQNANNYAKANNQTEKELWNLECFADRQLINFLLILMGKSVNVPSVFGKGASATSGGEGFSESEFATFSSGIHNDKGLFYGTNNGFVEPYNFTNCVKVFGMENYWGFMARRINGLMMRGGRIYCKFTKGKEDGSKTDVYLDDGQKYIYNKNLTMTGPLDGGFIKEMQFTDYGMFDKNTDGSETTYYHDQMWYTNSTSRYYPAAVGGVVDEKCGPFTKYMNEADPINTANYWDGMSISCRPLKEEEE